VKTCPFAFYQKCLIPFEGRGGKNAQRVWGFVSLLLLSSLVHRVANYTKEKKKMFRAFHQRREKRARVIVLTKRMVIVVI